MEVTFGKHKGVALEYVLLTAPTYVEWMLGEGDATGRLAAARAEAQRLVRAFDRLPFVEKCQGPGCGKAATRGTVHGANIQLVCWCPGCNPYGMGADAGKLQVVRTYSDALAHVGFHCAGRKGDYTRLVRNLAAAKGLKSRASPDSVIAFFAGDGGG